MNIKFWGVRGSLPAPITPSQIKSKISAILEQLTIDDIQNAESRERFMAGLPPWLFGTVGGNTPCVTVSLKNTNEHFIFDCGSGLREFGLSLSQDELKISKFHVFFSHFHWDHVQGLPFFGPIYNPSVKMDYYSPVYGIEDFLSGQMAQPYFPVGFLSTASIKKFHHMENSINIGGSIISSKKMNHPGDSYAYCIKEKGKRFIYATDTELTAADFMKHEENIKFFQDADLIVIDCQYTLGEAIDKYNWGHSAFSLAVDFAANWGIKHMVMFHHDPGYNDNKIYSLLQSARSYLDRMKIIDLELTLASEGLEITL
jgi:phosphoribosyl 1,2-cyclic phosphodiesterase